jgi:hypothetical protein
MEHESMSDRPRQLTTEEVRDRFLAHVRSMVAYWERVEVRPLTTRERLDGLAFSILAALDGASEMPGFIVAPCPHPSDRAFHESEGDNWYPENRSGVVECDIAGSLHERYGKR